MTDYHLNALSRYNAEEDSAAANEAALDEAASDIYGCLEMGLPINCGRYTLTYTDYSQWLGESGSHGGSRSMMAYAYQHAENRLAYVRGEK